MVSKAKNSKGNAMPATPGGKKIPWMSASEKGGKGMNKKARKGC